jgi:cyanophycinase
VLDHPGLVGVGIDEGTAVIVKDGSLEVIGKSAVVIVDARKATVDKAAPGSPATGRNLLLTILKSGQTYSLKQH